MEALFGHLEWDNLIGIYFVLEYFNFLDFNEITDKGAKDLVENLCFIPNLRILDLGIRIFYYFI